MGTAPEGRSGDLGRRLRARRLELGLSIDAVAKRAGMAPDYLIYLEGAVGSVGMGPLLRLAAALETTADTLTGGAIDRPPGSRPAGSTPVLETLSPAECARLLAGGGVGRLVFLAPDGPSAIPLNFRLLGGDIVVRTAEDGPVARAVAEAGVAVGFEVDHIDDAQREGWSVMLRGTARRVVDGAELADVRDLRIDPWAGNKRDVYVRITTTEVTGRRIRTRR